MSPTLEQDLDQLRKRYCTPFLQGKYSALKQQFQRDGEGIDPLIDCADFDVFWYPSVRTYMIDSLTFRIAYETGVMGWSKNIKVRVTREKKRFRLSDIEVE